MAQIAGVKVEKNPNGTLKTVTFDMEKYAEILNPILEDLGLIDDVRLQRKFYTPDKAKAETKNRLTQLCEKDNLLS